MPVIESIPGQDGKHCLWMFWCPGCKMNHSFDSRWTFNGNVDKPTFSPSLLVHSDGYHKKCHSFVREGKIQFLGDCEHELAGQTVDMEEIE